jgi:transcriptional regulator with XRE-family HTH domain
MIDLAGRLRALREAGGLTQSELAERLGIPSSAVSMIESGRRDIRVSTLERYLDALGAAIEFVPGDRVTTLDDILRRSDRGRARLAQAGLRPPSPGERLDLKARRGNDVATERRILDGTQ